ncbi:hypothetical protein HanXRQr2_Chr05g0197921 [Helianthus annuus]|uniref:Uncharacterized protein n=1 Tax=Helianthus annuus TaxID=4232 RepID=A0A251ULP6_HELAN|nr:hypothetical protein HanXRQr2_Chr05g0197921 [Helianthus annuus]KAJ0575517.1 hypothetical protein HanIR_Chr05g0213641 [Helianthus annuus]
MSMSHLSKIRNNLDFSPHPFVFTCQISGRNFFQVGDDVTTRTPKGVFDPL